MPQLSVRNVHEDTIKRLKVLAKQHGRSLQGQVKIVLEEAVMLSVNEVSSVVKKWQRRFAGKRFKDSTKILREDRRR